MPVRTKTCPHCKSICPVEVPWCGCRYRFESKSHFTGQAQTFSVAEFFGDMLLHLLMEVFGVLFEGLLSALF